jgi:hypothetical protein
MTPRETGFDACLIRQNVPTLWHRALVRLSVSQDFRDPGPSLLPNDRASNAPEQYHCLDVGPGVRMLLQMSLYSIVHRV